MTRTLIEDDRILDVGPADQLRAAHDADIVIDAAGKTVIPAS